MKRLAALCWLLACLLDAAGARADAPAFSSEARRARPAELLASNSLPLLRMGGAVALVIAAGGALTAWARSRGRRRAGPAGSIEVIAMRALGPRHRVAVVEVGNRRVLLGLASDAICTLLDLSEAAEFTQVLSAELPAAPAAKPEEPFAGPLGRFEGLDG